VVQRPKIVIVTPALASANNGNWQTARRWARFLSREYQVRMTATWQSGDEAIMIALHARRSAPSIGAWHLSHPKRPLIVVLTGTDLYRDIDNDAAAKESLRMADRLVVLNELGPDHVPLAYRDKVTVCLQSSAPRQPHLKTTRHLRALMVGHLRDEKSPQTYFEAARLLAGRHDILLDHIGGALDPALGAEAEALARSCPNYRWLGALPHGSTRAHIQAAHVLVHASRMEGGAQVIIEAVTGGTPVLASRIDGNVGMLGADYPEYFSWGDAVELSTLLIRSRDEPALLSVLQAGCDRRALDFAPEHERHSLLELLKPLQSPL
jgi:putative glycosyltransferase (TIGR04348 family)